jgi:hypothetical protein
VKSAFGLLKAFSNGTFSKVAKTYNPVEKKSAKSQSIETNCSGRHLQWIKITKTKDLLCT